jgi:hypothetical protein
LREALRMMPAHERLALAREVVDAELAAQDPPLWMYAIQAGHFGAVKLGITRDPRDRLRELQTSNAEPLRLVAAWRSFREEERQIHEEFADLRLRGEWFRPHDEILRLVRGMAATYRGYKP